MTAQQPHPLTHVLDRLSRDLAGQSEASVLDALRVDPELADWGWTDARLTLWARQIAASEQATVSSDGGIAD